MNTIKDNFNSFVHEYVTPTYVMVAHVTSQTVKSCTEGHAWLNRKVEVLFADNLPTDVGNMMMAVWAVLPEIIAVASLWLSSQNAILVSDSAAGTLWSLYMIASLTPIFNWAISRNWTVDGLIDVANQVKPDVMWKLQKLSQAIAVCATGAAIITIVPSVVGCGYLPSAIFQGAVYGMIALSAAAYQTVPETESSIEEIG